MDNLFQNNSGEKSEHPPREMLLLFVDGELLAKEATQLETHLEACWPCRVKTKKIQEAIADIIEFDEQVLTPRILPPQGWRNFDRQLNQLAAATGKQSLTSRLFGSLGRFLPSSHLLALPPLLLRPMVRKATAILVVVAIGALVIRFKHEPTLSASELLRYSIEAQSREIHTIDEAVVHEKLQVRRKSQGSAREEYLNWEIWNDTKNSRVRQFLGDGNQAIPVAGNPTSKNERPKETTGREIIDELARVLEANHMDRNRPLSAASYQSWHNTLQRQQDEVTKSKLADGADALTLRTVPAAPVSLGQIAEALFVVRAKDWQPTELRLNVVAEGENRIYELTETISEVVSLAQVNPAIFADQPALSPSPASVPKEAAKKETQPTPALAPNRQPLIPAPVATADLEIEVTYLLDQVKANLGDQVSLTRTAEGQLRVQGIVDTDKRKAEILSALASVANNPAVRIDVQTVEEALRRQRQRSSDSVVAGTLSATEGTGLPIDSQLRHYLAARGVSSDRMDEQIREFSNRIIARSRQAMRHAFALKRLAEQFKEEQVQTLSPDSLAKRLSMFSEHAQEFERETRLLRAELEPVFPSSSATSADVNVGMDIKNEADLATAVRRLFELSSSYDKAIGSAFAISSEASAGSGINKPQFWQSLRGAEKLAALIQNAPKALNAFK